MAETEPPPQPTKKIRGNHHQSSSSNSDKGVYVPVDVLEIIFTFLPIKDAIKIGTLSKRFRNLWLWNKNLDFEQSLVARRRGIQDYRFIKTVDGILRRHLQPEIRRMKLFFNPMNDYQRSKLDEWVDFALRKGAREIDLDFRHRHGYYVNYFKKNGYYVNADFELKPGHKFMQCSSLTVLKLCHCTIRCTKAFDGLRSLTTLVLRHVYVNSLDFITGIKRETCLFLETLDLIQCQPSLSFAGIIALHLRWFPNSERFLVQFDLPGSSNYQHDKMLPAAEGNFSKISFSEACSYDTLQLSGFYLSNVISKLISLAKELTTNQQSQLRNLLREFPHADVMTINKTFVQTLEGPQTCLKNLKELHLSMEEDSSYCNPYYVVLLLRSCPSLERVFINLEGFEPSSKWSLDGMENILHLNDWFQRLKYVKLSAFKPVNADLEWVKFFLEKAVVLETLALILLPKKSDGRHPGVCVEDVNGYVDLFYLSRRKSSINAQIQVFDYSRDDGCLEPAHNLIQSKSFCNHAGKFYDLA